VVALEAELTAVTLKRSSEAEEGRSHEVCVPARRPPPGEQRRSLSTFDLRQVETLQRALLSVELEAQLLREEVGVAQKVFTAF